MKTKIISYFLIYCFVIQTLLYGNGCMSFYPTEGENNLMLYKNGNERLLIKLKDKSEIEIPENSICLIEKDKIDSSKVEEVYSNFYKIYWMKDNQKLVFKLGETYKFVPDSGNGFWFVMDKDKKEFKQIYDNDIAEIQERKTNWTD